ncbi:hypothetical protein ACJMK2_015851 [Sinanodonta woodiana]|uniref:PDZ domain-containing protein n=1 Tax=Sinanodonta woodiana TaxID=1069815 RepID=A0ABD3USP9_SINWO
MDFMILKVNGQDLSQATHEEAVEAFRTAREPIVVEVLRRVNSNKTPSSKMRSRSPTMVSIGTQTDEDIYGLDRPPTPPPTFYPFYNSGLFQPASRRPVVFSPSTEMGLTDIEMAQNYDCDDPYFEEQQYDMEYEEVILQCQNTEEKLGLTLCYGSAEDGVTDIFIGEIEPYSIAAKDGRIREGDQIIQINGVDVHSRDQVIQLFSDRGSEITLLVARPQLQFDDGFMEEHNMVLDALQMDILEKHHHDNMQIMASMLARGHHFDEEGGTTDTGTTENSSHKHEKDSGVGRTDESTKNDESSEQEAFDTECTSSPANTKLRPHADSSDVHYCRINQSSEAHYSSFNQSDAHYSNDSVISNDLRDSHDFTENDVPAVDCEQFREALKHCCDKNRQESLNSPKLNSRKDSESSLDRELALLNKEMENIQLECQEIVDNHIRDRNKIQPSPKDSCKSDTYRTPRSVPRMGTRLEYVKHAVVSESPENWARKENQPSPKTVQQSPQGKSLDKEKDPSTTSAYNSGESCRSTPLPVTLCTLELNQTSDEGDKGFKNSLLCLAPPDTSSAPSLSDTEKQTQTPSQLRQCSGSENIKPDTNHLSNEQKEELPAKVGMGESLQDLYMQYADVMYTNKANLQHTIQIQQKLFQQQLDQRARIRGTGDKKKLSQQLTSSPKRSGSTTGHNSDSPSQNITPPDSSVQMEWVVKRRPDGSRYITRRPVRNKLLKERAKKINEERCGMTTDDDAMSELKTGRYWTKEERKRHLEKARDHKKRRELMIKAKMETLKEADEKKELNILELSHRKMMKHKGKRVLDDFTTVQEMLAHGSRGGDGKNYHPLLSVTTV